MLTKIPFGVYSFQSVWQLYRDLEIFSLECTESNENISDYELSMRCLVGQLESVHNICTKSIDSIVSKESVSVPELVEFGECCSECIKIIVGELKSAKYSLGTINIPKNINRSTSEELPIFGNRNWDALLSRLLANCTQLLLLDSVMSQDVLSTTALGVTSILKVSCKEDDIVLQTLQFLHELRLKQEYNISTIDVHDSTKKDTLSEQIRSRNESLLIPEFMYVLLQTNKTSQNTSSLDMQKFPHQSLVLSTISRCALLRSIFSVMTDEILTYSDGREICLILHPYLIDSILAVCQNQTVSNQYYGVQTLETWIGRLQSIFSNNTVPIYQGIVQLILKVIKVVLDIWRHPYKQINHTAPSIFSKAVNLLLLLIPADNDTKGPIYYYQKYMPN